MLGLGCGGKRNRQLLPVVSAGNLYCGRCPNTTIIVMAFNLPLTLAFSLWWSGKRMMLQLKLIVSYYAQLDQTYGLSAAVAVCPGESIVYYCPSISRLIPGCLYFSLITEALLSSERRLIWCCRSWCPVSKECYISAKRTVRRVALLVNVHSDVLMFNSSITFLQSRSTVWIVVLW